jgi:hypothetical protein
VSFHRPEAAQPTRNRWFADSPAEEAGFELLVSLQDWCSPCAGPMTRNPVWRVSERLLFSGRDRRFECHFLQRGVYCEPVRAGGCRLIAAGGEDAEGSLSLGRSRAPSAFYGTGVAELLQEDRRCSPITIRTAGWSMPGAPAPASSRRSCSGCGEDCSRQPSRRCPSRCRRRATAASALPWF